MQKWILWVWEFFVSYLCWLLEVCLFVRVKSVFSDRLRVFEYFVSLFAFWISGKSALDRSLTFDCDGNIRMVIENDIFAPCLSENGDDPTALAVHLSAQCGGLGGKEKLLRLQIHCHHVCRRLKLLTHIGKRASMPVTHRQLSDLQKIFTNLAGNPSTTPSSQPPPGIPSPVWQTLGFQGTDPCTDFRATGQWSLDCLLDITQLPRIQEIWREAEKGKFYWSFAICVINFCWEIKGMIEWRKNIFADDKRVVVEEALFGDHKSIDPHPHTVKSKMQEHLKQDIKRFANLLALFTQTFHEVWVREEAENLFAYSQILPLARHQFFKELK